MQKWTKEEEKFLQENYRVLSFDEIAKKLNRSYHSIQRRMDRFRVKNNASKIGRWSKEEMEFLEFNKESMTNQEIADKLGRTLHSVEGKRSTLSNMKRLSIGDRSGKFIILDISKWTKENKRRIATCKCDCGNIVERRLDSIKPNGDCGCSKHMLSATRIYDIWNGMKRRCYNENADNYKYYGGKGVIVCKEWLDDFMNFYNWSINNGYDSTLSIERKNVDKNYEPNNCKWATIKEQSKNKSNNVYILAFGENKILADWIKDNRSRTDASILAQRIKNGWDSEVAIVCPNYIARKFGRRPTMEEVLQIIENEPLDYQI